MAKQIPFFLTGANAKIKLNGVTLAFCANFGYSVRIESAAPRVLGQYEIDSIEPLSYNVAGSFTIIRYAKNLKEKVEKLGMVAPDGVSNKGGGLGNWQPSNSKEGRANENADPSKLSTGGFFDIEVYQKIAGGLIDSGNTNKKPEVENILIAKLRKARIIEFDLILAKRDVANQRFSFIATYLDEDTFNANFSAPWRK
jgi:hypothetical protein